jgi:hypothetical protein
MNLLKTSLESLHIILQNITEKENTLKLNPQIKERYPALKIRIYSNKEQKLKFNNFLNELSFSIQYCYKLYKRRKKNKFYFYKR